MLKKEVKQMLKWYINAMTKYFDDILNRFEGYNINKAVLVNHIICGMRPF